VYGTIPRGASDARRLVLDLAEIFRYSLQSDRTFIPLSEEIQIVRAYLQIEQARLGDRLQTEIVVEEPAERSMIPILSVQPLVENAVKHGVAARSGPGKVRVHARTLGAEVLVEVSDDGRGFGATGPAPGGAGIGLENVRQRLRLCFGERAEIQIASNDRGATVAFRIPAHHASQEVSQEVSV
jgi:two-component system LytT family sensor kinase